MFKQLICVLLLTSCIVASARAEQGCPYPAQVSYVDGHYRAEDNGLRWQSPKVKYRGLIDGFIGAVFIPGEDEQRENGYMDKCIYRTGWDGVVALRPYKDSKIINMSLTSTLYWELRPGAFTLPGYTCTDSQPDNCAFNVNDKRTDLSVVR
ncbi:DUF3757 domain-containing protein [Pseudomonas sp. W2Jun17]|uniref:DUF3757 domain-containing protein n=1 Tax=Pseudomonas sp. W2Jun17 TaxID=1553460 RepID=UPI0020032C5F|nr:DUF3757 domain-containing protein [Pseudomonas sp. W2Jun17]MCK3849920.1 DUF3757 domain-containing protein [Pseudomonas sp. W2Jun17]